MRQEAEGNGARCALAWWRAPNALIDRHAAALGPSGLAVYAVLARHQNAQGEAWPSVARIATLLGLDGGTVKAALRRLLGERCIMRRSRPGRVSVYVLPDLGGKSTQVKKPPGRVFRATRVENPPRHLGGKATHEQDSVNKTQNKKGARAPGRPETPGAERSVNGPAPEPVHMKRALSGALQSLGAALAREARSA